MAKADEVDVKVVKQVKESVESLNTALGNASRSGIKVELQEIDVTTMSDKTQRLMFNAKLFKEL